MEAIQILRAIKPPQGRLVHSLIWPREHTRVLVWGEWGRSGIKARIAALQFEVPPLDEHGVRLIFILTSCITVLMLWRSSKAPYYEW